MKIFGLAFVLATVFTMAGSVSMGPVGPAALQAAGQPSDTVIVYQFHRRFRCEECYKLEEAIRETLDQHFSRELEDGSVVFKVVDLDAEGNDFYEKRYEFFYNTVIVAQVREEKDVRFKNLEKVWSLADDRDKLKEFVKAEVTEYIDNLEQ